MSIFRKIMTAVRGGTNEIAELIVDANGTRIFEQEIKDAQNHLSKAKQDLTGVMAKQIQAQRQLESVRRDLADHEGYARQALAQNNEPLALEVAEKIARLEVDVSEQQTVYDTFTEHADRLKALVKKTERQIKDYERQLTMVKTTESVQRASAAITDNFSSTSSKMLSAKDSLQRIKRRQQENFDRLAAAEQLEAENVDASLEQKLKAAGIGHEGSSSANAVLERLRQRQGIEHQSG